MRKSFWSLLVLVNALLLGCGGDSGPPPKVETPSASEVGKDGKMTNPSTAAPAPEKK